MGADWDKVPGPPAQPMSSGRIGLIVVGVIAVIGVMLAISSGDDESSSAAPAARPTATPRPVATMPTTYRVVYRVTTSNASHPISLTYENASGNTEQLETRTNRDRLWTEAFDAEPGAFVYVSAQNRRDSGWIQCEILIDGIVTEEARSEGAYVIASCSGTARR